MEHSGSEKKISGKTILILIASVLLLTIGFAVPVYWYPQHIKKEVARLEQELYNSDIAKRNGAYTALRNYGISGRMALLRAVQSDDDKLGRDMFQSLDDLLVQDVLASRDVRPVVFAALDEMNIPGKPGKRSAGIASVGLPLGILSEQEKQAVLMRCLRADFYIRKVYPLDSVVVYNELDRGYLSQINQHILSRSHSISIDGQKPNYSFSSLPVGASGSGHHYLRPPLGKHSAALCVKIEYDPSKADKRYQPVLDMTPWQTTVTFPAVPFKVVDVLPENYLQVKVTPENRKLVEQSISIRQGLGKKYSIAGNSPEGSVIDNDTLPIIVANPPLPFGLAFQPMWKVVGSGKTFAGGDNSLMQGVDEMLLSSPPRELLDDLTVGKHTLTIRLILEPSQAALFQYLKVEQYWPEPIELPPFKLKIEKKKAADVKKEAT